MTLTPYAKSNKQCNQVLCFLRSYYADSPYRSEQDEQQLHAVARVLSSRIQRQNHAEGMHEQSLQHHPKQ